MTGAGASSHHLRESSSGRRGSRLGVFLCALLLVLGAGCAERDFASLRPVLDKEGHYISGVPFVKQDEDSCGPAALVSVASYWGKRVSLEQVRAEVYLPQLRGTLPMDMGHFLQEQGFATISSAGTLAALKEQIRKDIPVICLLDLGFSVYRRPHYVTVIGFDDVDAVIIAHDGLRADRVIAYDTFLKRWGRAGYWMLVSYPEAAQDRGRQ